MITPLSHEDRISKLYKQFIAHGKLIIGVDFDNTLVDTYSGTCEPITKVVSTVQQLKKQGHTICVWTANSNKEFVTSTLQKIGVEFDYYNKSPISPDYQKQHFNILLDDVAGLSQALLEAQEVLQFNTKDYHD